MPVSLGGGRRLPHRQPPSMRGMLVRFVVAGVVGALVVLLGGLYVSRQAAQREALAEAGRTTDLLADAVVIPNLDDGLLRADPAAVARLDRQVREHLLGYGIVRVKLWDADGRVVYSDEPRLIGTRHTLSDNKLQALRSGSTDAEVSDLRPSENVYERSAGRLLEVYHAVNAPSGTPLLFETYFRYDAVDERATDVWWAFAPITFGVLILLEVVQLPLVWGMVRRVRQAAREREDLLQRAVEASDEERRRIAGNLHDGVVQDLAGSSYVVAGAVGAVSRAGLPEVADSLRHASGGIRESIRGLRSMLVEIYPPNLRIAGLDAALHDLVATLRSHGMDVTVDIAADLDIGPAEEALVFRVAQEAVRNVARHSGAHRMRLRVDREPPLTVLTVDDDGVGFSKETVDARVAEGHLGLRMLGDLVTRAGGRLVVTSAPGHGTTLRLEVGPA